MMEEFPQQLYDAISRLELTFLECNRLIELSNHVDTAAWCYNSESKEEKILFNPEFLNSLDETECEIVIRHEIQHKALFKELGRLDLDHELLNVALDIAISRVLSRSYDSQAFGKYCNELYGRYPPNVNTVLALAWYGLDPERIEHDQIRKYYRELWRHKKDPSPIEIYYRILEISGYEELLPGRALGESGKGRAKGEKGESPKGDSHGREKEKGEDEPESNEDEDGGKDEEDDGEGPGPEDGQKGGKKKDGQGPGSVDGPDRRKKEDSAPGPAGSGGGPPEGTYVRSIPADDLEDMRDDEIGKKALEKGKGERHYRDWLRELEIEKDQFEALEIEDFIKRIESVDVLDRTAERIRSSVHQETKRQMYPFQPTRLGHIYMLTGISQILHQYWNKVSSNRIPRLNIYVDVSPSMVAFREKGVFLIDRLKDLFPTTFFVFGTGVKEFNVSDFAAGKYPVAYGTDFNPVVKHLMGSDVECGVIFTDGEAYVERANQIKFGRSGKRLFTVYFNRYKVHRKDGANPVRSDLDEISEEVMQIDLFEAQTGLTFRTVL